jgi:ABC-type sugar transport system permease subunit
MATVARTTGSPSGGPVVSRSGRDFLLFILKLLGLMVLNGFGLILIYSLIYDNNLVMALVLALIVIFGNVVVLVPSLFPFKWMAPGLMLATMFVIYPIFFTVQTAFTNYSDGNLLPKEQTIALISERGFVPVDAVTYSWLPFRGEGDESYALWLTDNDGNAFFALPGQPVEAVASDITATVTNLETGLAGFERVEDQVAAMDGRTELDLVDPIGRVVIETLAPDAAFLFDPASELTLGQGNGRVYTTALYRDPEGNLAVWLVIPGATRGTILRAGEAAVDLEFNDVAKRREANVEIGFGSEIPDRIGAYERIGTGDVHADTLDALELGTGNDLLITGSFDPDDRFVYDPSLMLIADRQFGGFYEVTVYQRSEDGAFAFFIDGGRRGQYLILPDGTGYKDGIPLEYRGFTQITDNRERSAVLSFLQTVDFDYFGVGDDTVGIASTRSAGRPYLPRYEYDAETDSFTDRADGQVYTANDEIGWFVPPGGTEQDALIPGYRVNIGLENFERLVTDPALRGPLVTITIWTFVFAGLSVVTTFVMGMFMAIILDAPRLRGRYLIRSLLIIPYAIPGTISVLIWRGMLNQNLGLISTTIRDITGVTIPWFQDAGWAKFAIILVNLWLGYPYMMLIVSGALQAIPSDIYEAAAVDGARVAQRFWRITLPLLLVTVGPLLIASFVYNFNNYILIEALTEGNPPIPGSIVPAGYTDILISYTYNAAFGSSRGADYGYASAITIVIFAIVAVITMVQYRFTRTWEEVGESV